MRKAVIGALAVLALAGASWYMAWQQSSRRLHMVIEVPGVTFLQPGEKLAFASEVPHAEMLPVPLYPFLVTGWRAREIKGLSDLAGHVAIRSPEAALQYDRLVTPFLGSDWRHYWNEVALEGDLGIGKQADLLFMGWNSVWPMTKRDWTHNHLTPPTVTRVGDSFVVTRYLFTFAGNSTNIVYRAEETVSPDGRITRRLLGKKTLSGTEIQKLKRQ